MEMERGNPKSRKRLETRLLHFQQFPGTQEYGDQYWRGYTYVWNDEQTDAELLDEKGADKMLKIKVGDKMVEQNYRFPSRAECTLCHTNAAKFALGVNTHADEPRSQLRRRHRQPTGDAGPHRPVHEEAAEGAGEAAEAGRFQRRRRCPWTCGPAPICTPTAPIAT